MAVTTGVDTTVAITAVGTIGREGCQNIANFYTISSITK
jgi:hypothetical protein